MAPNSQLFIPLNTPMTGKGGKVTQKWRLYLQGLQDALTFYPLSPDRGGTGINNGTHTLTLGGVTKFLGNFPVTFNFTGSTNVTFPTSGTLLTVETSLVGVLWGDGVSLQTDPTRFFWNDTTHRLGLLTNAPETPIDVDGIAQSNSVQLRDKTVAVDAGGLWGLQAGHQLSANGNAGAGVSLTLNNSAAGDFAQRVYYDVGSINYDLTSTLLNGNVPIGTDAFRSIAADRFQFNSGSAGISRRPLATATLGAGANANNIVAIAVTGGYNAGFPPNLSGAAGVVVRVNGHINNPPSVVDQPDIFITANTDAGGVIVSFNGIDNNPVGVGNPIVSQSGVPGQWPAAPFISVDAPPSGPPNAYGQIECRVDVAPQVDYQRILPAGFVPAVLSALLYQTVIASDASGAGIVYGADLFQIEDNTPNNSRVSRRFLMVNDAAFGGSHNLNEALAMNNGLWYSGHGTTCSDQGIGCFDFMELWTAGQGQISMSGNSIVLTNHNGTPNPAVQVSADQGSLQVNSTTNTNVAYFQASNSPGNFNIGQEQSTGGGLITGTLAYAGVIGLDHSHALQFATNNAVRMTIDNAGLVGIGTAAPAKTLHVVTASGAFTVDTAAGTVNLSTAQSATSNADMNFLAKGTGLFTWVQGSTEAMRINSSGYVGINNAAPGSRLSVVGLPTSSAGLSTGDIWVDTGAGNVLKIV